MSRYFYLFFALFVSMQTIAQEGSDIYLFNFHLDANRFSLSNPRNATNSPGFDGQPAFMANSESFLYSADDGFGQTDVYRYNLSSQSERRLTFTPDSEYSPTPTPNQEFFSCIVHQRSGDKKLWKFPIHGAVPTLLSNIESIERHFWVDNNTIQAYVSGQPNALELIDVTTDKRTNKISENPGLSFQSIPKTNLLSYIEIDGISNTIMSYDPVTLQKNVIIKTKNKSEYYTWTPNGILLSGDGEKLYKYDPTIDKDWVEVANINDYGLKQFSQITVSPSGNLLAMVIKE